MNAIKIKIALPVGLTQDYDALRNKPKINDVTLEGNKTSEDLHLTSDASFEEFKQQVTDDLDKKLDKVTDITAYQAAYVTKRDGSQSTVEISYPSKADTIPIRNTDGSISGVQKELTSYSDLQINRLYTLGGLWLKTLKLIDDKSYDSQTMLTTKSRVSLCFLRDVTVPYNVIFQPKAGTVAYTEDIDAEATARKQADDALQSSIDAKLDKSAIVQETGTAEDKVMSQKATTDALDGKVDKAERPNQGYAVYVIAASDYGSDPKTVPVKLEPEVDTLPGRTDKGTLRAQDAIIDDDLVTLRQLTTKLLNYLLKSGGIISGNLSIQGDLEVRGTTKTTEEETLNVKDSIVVTNSSGADLSSTLAGFVIRLNATDCYGIIYDASSESVKLGKGKITDGKFTFNSGEGNAVAIRADGTLMTNGHLVKWDATALKFVDAGKSVTDFVLKRNKTGDYAYGIVSGYEGTWPISTTPTSLAIPHYDSRTLNLRTSTPVADLDCVNKQYFEANAGLLKHDNDFTTNGNEFNPFNIDGGQTTGWINYRRAGGSTTIDNISFGNGDGQGTLVNLSAALPKLHQHVAIKGYVDSAITTATAVLIDNSLLGG